MNEERLREIEARAARRALPTSCNQSADYVVLIDAEDDVPALIAEVRRLKVELETVSRNLQQVIAKRKQETAETYAEALRDAADVVRTYENDRNLHGQEDYARALERMANDVADE